MTQRRILTASRKALLRHIVEERTLGDSTTLADPNVVASLKGQYEDNEG